MTFTPGFENDIFISYCHDDNDAPRDEPGWVDHFHERLESSLAQRFGRREIVIWRDKKLQGSTLFDQRIQEQIHRSALFLALISPNYLKSEYCRKELAWFFAEAQKSTYGLSVNHEYRILPVFLRNIGHTAWPTELKGISGFPMHDQEEDSEKRGAALDHREVLYTKKLRFIVDAVETILPLFPGNGAEPGEGAGGRKADEAEQRRQEEQERLQKEKTTRLAKEAEEQALIARMNKLKEEEKQLAERERQLKEKGKLLEKQAGSQEKVKRLTRVVYVAIALAVIMTAGLVYVAVKNEKKANYNLARLFDEKAMSGLASGQKTNDPARFRDAWLYMTAALRQEIDGQKLPLRPESAGALLNTAVINAALGSRFVSPPAIDVSAPVFAVAFSPDGQTIASGSVDKPIRLWDVISKKEIACLTGHTGCVSSVAFSPDGRTIASGYDDNTIRLWDVYSKKEIATLKGHSGMVHSVAFSPDGRTIASGSRDNTIRLWDKESQKAIATLTGHTNGVISVAFSPDGRTIASGSGDNTIRLWDVNSRKEIACLTGHTRAVTGVAFSPDGRTIASSSFDNTIRLWDWETKKATATLTGHTYLVSSVAFSPDGRTIASCSWDKTIRLWDVDSRKEIACLTGHEGSVFSIVFRPDGRAIASGSDDRTIRLWDLRIFNLFLKGGKPIPLFFTFAAGAEFFWGFQWDGSGYQEVGRPANPDKKFLPLLEKPAPGQSKFDQILAWAQAQERNK